MKASNGRRESASPVAAPVALSPACGESAAFPHQIRVAFGMLQSAIEEAADTVGDQNVKLAVELEDLQARALRSIQDSALATIELLEAIGAARSPGDLVRSQMELAKRQRDTAHTRLADFFATAKSLAALMSDPLDRQFQALSGSVASPKPFGDDPSVLARLKKLTLRQKRVLELLAEGLPNKVIAHRLGISETTVKAHVGEILRKLGVYNRARAIVMLGQLDSRALREALDPSGDQE